MARLPIRIIPDPVLREVAKPVAAVDDRVRRLMDDMLETMYGAEGIGLAAPQIGVSERIIVVDVDQRDDPGSVAPMRMVNPEIVSASDLRSKGSEGCLSIPDQKADVERHAEVTVRYLDETGQVKTLEADGLLSVCLQHEIDHLNGVLFIDHISKLKRDMIVRRVRKRAREAADD